LTGNHPFAQHKPLQLISAFIKGEKPSPRGVFYIPDKTVSALADKCWDYDPKKRPIAQKAQETLANSGVRDTRPNPIDPGSAAWVAAQRAKSYTKFDYDAVLPILRQVSSAYLRRPQHNRLILDS
jgi:hypothetical protein